MAGYKTYEELLSYKLSLVSDKMDKRQGSVIYDTLAPNAAESAKIYMDMDMLLDRTFGDTAEGGDLTRRAAERNINRYPAAAAVLLGEFKDINGVFMDVEPGERFSGDDKNYEVTERISFGSFKLICEQAGEAGNEYIGELIPIGYIADLGTAEITEVLVPGEDEEDDEALRKRYYKSFTSNAFGGNIEDYIQKTNSIQGVGGTKVIPVWDGGGTVKLIITDSEYKEPSESLISYVQSEIDPLPGGNGLGIAPIGHIVTVSGAAFVEIDIEFTATLESGLIWDDVAAEAEGIIEGYFKELREMWARNTALVIRVSQIESRLLDVNGILDIEGTRLNNTSGNLLLQFDEVPAVGTVMPV